MVQGYKVQGSGSFRSFFTAGNGEDKGDCSVTEGRGGSGGTRIGELVCKQRTLVVPRQFKLCGPETSAEKLESRLSISGLGSLYYLRKFHVMHMQINDNLVRQLMDRLRPGEVYHDVDYFQHL